MPLTANRRELENFVMLGTLGEGSFGVVKRAVHTPTATEVAIKILPKSCEPDTFLDREVAAMKMLSHQHIVQLFQILDTEDEVLLVMELAPGGDLEGYICRCGLLAEAEARRLFQQIVAALSHCHAHGVAHRDLKPENLLLDQHRNIKLTDFGFCGQFSRAGLLHTPCGTPEFAAPELYLRQKYSGPAADVWSLGVVLYDMVTGELPFVGVSEEDVRDMVLRGDYYEPSYLSQPCRDLLRKMLMRDPKSRSSLARVIQHPWVGLENGLPPSRGPCPRHIHEAATKTMVGLGFRREDIDRALLEAKYDAVMGTYLILVSQQRAAEEWPDPAITPKLFSPDGAHCALMSEHRAQKAANTAGQGIPQEDAYVPSLLSGPGPLQDEAWKASVAYGSRPRLREAWGPGIPQEEAPGPCTTLPALLLKKITEHSSTSSIALQLEGPEDERDTCLPGPQREGDPESRSKSSSPAPKPPSPAPQLSSPAGTAPPRSGWRRLLRKVAPAERHPADHSDPTHGSRGGCKARARRFINNVLKCISCAPFRGKHQAKVHPAPGE